MPGWARSSANSACQPIPTPCPHIYRPLDLDAVIETRPFSPGPNGRFSFGGET